MVNTHVEVIWHDAHSDTTSWIDVNEIGREPCEVTTVGILIHAVKAEHIVIAQSINSFQQYDCVLNIPVGMVRSMRVLQRGEDDPSRIV